MRLLLGFMYIAVSAIGLTDSSPSVASTISIGGSHACALSKGGEAYCWGRADGGELGDGDTEFPCRRHACSRSGQPHLLANRRQCEL